MPISKFVSTRTGAVRVDAVGIGLFTFLGTRDMYTDLSFFGYSCLLGVALFLWDLMRITHVKQHSR